MSQTPSRFCQQCGISLQHGQWFCSNCGARADFNAANPTELTPDQALAVDSTVPPPPPPPLADLYTQSAQPFMYAQPPSYIPYPPPAQGYQQPPGYAVPQKDSSKSVLVQTGCGVLAVILVVLLICGALGYFGWQFLASRARTSSTPGTSSTANNSNTGSSGSNSSFTTQPTITTVQLNEKVNFFGVDITVVSAQQSQTFLDDSSSSTTGMVRLNLKEDNKSTSSARYLYSDEARLILPDKTSVAPVNEQQFGGPDGGVSRSNWLDFPVPTSVKISQLTLQLGGETKAQETIPLTGKASLAQYQPKTAQLNVATQYAGLTWTITTATVSLGFKGQQADKGMQYVTVTLKVDNPTTQTFRGYYGDYIRLKSGDSTSAPTGDTTLPLSFDSGSSGSTGDVVFIMPSSSASYTLIFLANPYAQYTQTTANFQVG